MEKRILILFHKNDNRFNVAASGAHILASLWRNMGYRVTYQFGTGKHVPADLIFIHVDLSVVPDEYVEYANCYPVAINRQITDIRKSRISGNLVESTEAWDGPVIVKTVLNFAGRPEYLLGDPVSAFSTVTTRNLRLFWQNRVSRIMGRPTPFSGLYRKYENYGEVPDRIKQDPGMVIERFLPEEENGTYTIRMYRFLGSKGRCRIYRSNNPFVNSNARIDEADDEPHPIVETWKKQLGIDYGKFDYVIHEGEPVLLDVNKTPGSARRLIPPSVLQNLCPELSRIKRHQLLANGIADFLDC